MTTMTADYSKERPDARELQALYDQGHTNVEIARMYCVAEGTVKSWRSRYGLATRRPRYKEVIPWHVLKEHIDEYPLRMLQVLGRRLSGLQSTPQRERKLDSFLLKLQGNHEDVDFDLVPRVVAYAPWRTPGFVIVPGEWVDGKIPIREAEEQPPDAGGKHKRYDLISEPESGS